MDKKSLLNKLRKYVSNITDTKYKICDMIRDANKDIDWYDYDMNDLTVDYNDLVVSNKKNSDSRMKLEDYVSAAIDNDFDAIKSLFIENKPKIRTIETFASIQAEYNNAIINFGNKIIDYLRSNNYLVADVGDVVLCDAIYFKIKKLEFKYENGSSKFTVIYNGSTCDKYGEPRQKPRDVNADEVFYIKNHQVVGESNIKNITRKK